MKKSLKITLIAAGVAIMIAVCSLVAVSAHKNSSEYILSLAERYLSELDYEQAIIQYEKLIEIEPKNTDAYLKLADAYYQNDDIDKAIETLQKALEIVNDEAIKAKLTEYEKIKNPPVTTTTAVTTTAPVTSTTTTPATTTTPETTTTSTTEEPFVVETVVINGVEYQTDITELDLSWQGILTEDDLENIAKCKKLVSLDMKYVECHDENGNSVSDYSFISKMRDLERLALPLACDFSVVKGLNNLKYLCATSPEMIHFGFDLDDLRGLDNLEELDVGGCNCYNIEALISLKNLKILSIYGPFSESLIHEDNINIFTSLTQLEELYIGDGVDQYSEVLAESLSGCVIERY